MTTNKPILWVAIVAALSMPVAVQAQHAGHETHATPRSVAPLSSAEQHAHGQHDDHTEADDTQHGDRPEMDHADHSQMDHSRMDHSRMDHASDSSGDPNQGSLTPEPRFARTHTTDHRRRPRGSISGASAPTQARRKQTFVLAFGSIGGVRDE